MQEHIKKKIEAHREKRNAKKEGEIPAATVNRLPRYYRVLRELVVEGHLRISSGELSRIMELNASQIRQDLGCFGGFGQQGYGYNVKYLYTKISDILGVPVGYNAVIVGMGWLGRELALGSTFTQRGVELIALFDSSPDIIGEEIGGLTVRCVSELEAFCSQSSVDIVVLTQTRTEAPDTIERLVGLDIGGIWNYSGCRINTGESGIIVREICLGDSLMTLCYELGDKRRGGDGE